MVDVSRETEAQTELRLLRVVRMAELKVCDAAYAFREIALANFPRDADPDALAHVRDDDVWSELVPDDGTAAEPFRLFRFHFPPGIDNSGFVGWLASRRKRQFGTGVFVVCGDHGRRGGIHDDRDIPVSPGSDVIAAVRAPCASA